MSDRVPTPSTVDDTPAAARFAAAAGTRPRSATAALTALAGFVVAVAAIALMRLIDLPPYLKAMAITLAPLTAMIAIDTLYFRTRGNLSTGLAPRPLRPFDSARTIRKLVGFAATIGAIAFIYWLFPEYTGAYYQPFRDAARLVMPVVLLAAPFYVVYVDRRQLSPDDAYAQIGALLLDRRLPDLPTMGQHARGWLVKGFFFPLMFVIAASDIDSLSRTPFVINEFKDIFDRGYDFAYLIDVTFASIGYFCTLRVLDTQVRSAEPTLFGWAICLICYPPFWSVLEASYLHYEADSVYWGTLFYGQPVIYTLWGSTILLLVGIYAAATVAFGLRFSNLTNRGIITTGPYRWIKHPAYVAKNASFWLISVPFLSTMGAEAAVKQCLLLAGVNTIYFLRAWTEERHLAADPDYQAYVAWIREHGLVAKVRRLLFGAPAGVTAAG